MKKALLYLFVVSFVVLYTQESTAQSPAVTNLSLDAFPDGNSTNDELEANYTTNPSVVETATAWYRNGSPQAILYLPFEGGESNALLDFSGSGNDASTTGYVSSTPVWSMTGGYNGAGAFEFDGDDYLYAGNIMPLNSSYTKTAWVYDTGSGYRNIISSTLQINYNHSFNLHPDNTLHAGHSFGNAIVSDLDPINQNEWYFVAVTFDYETGEMALYKNAVQVDREIVPDSLRSIVDPGVLIGAKNNLYAWRGTIDEPRIYDHVLTDAQLRNMFVEGNDEILPGETRIEEEWQAHVTPFSTSEVGATETSNIITLESMSITTPVLTAATVDNLTSDDLSVSYTSSGSVVETATAWFRDGTPDALLYFPFEGGPINGFLDYSGNENNLSRSFDAIRVPRWDSDNGHNSTGAYYFNGNDWLEVADVFPLNSSYTKSAWVYASSFGDNNIMSSRLHGANNHHLKIDSDGVLNAGHSFGSEIVNDATPLTSHTWYFVALTFDYATGLMTLYRDGVQVDQATVPEALRDVIDATVQIGSMQTVYGWEGYIDDARLHDRVLSEEQILSLYSTGKNALVSEETTGGEEWQVRVTSFSSSEIGEQLSSNTLTVQSVLVADILDQSISEGESFNTIDLAVYLTTLDFPEDDIVWSSTGSSELTVTIDPLTHIATIAIPDADWFGTEDITFTATNPNSDEGSTEVTFTVLNVNDAPEIAELGDQLTNESTPLTGLTVDFTDVDPGDTYTITVVSGEGNVVVENLTGNTTGATYDLVPAAGWFGSAIITVTVTDDGDGPLFDEEIYTLTVGEVNDAPVLGPTADQSTDEDITLSGLTVDFTDPDAGDTHTIDIASDDANVTAANISGTLSGSTYDLVPAADWNGSAEITVTVTDDGTGTLSDVETFTFTVNPINDAPVLSPTADQSSDEDNTLTGLTVDFTDAETGDTHTIDIASDDANVTAANISGTLSGSTYDLVPAADWNGSAEITVTVTDDGTGTLSDVETFTFTVNPINDAPVLSPTADQSADEDNTLSGLSVAFTDAETGDAHTIDIASDDANVTAVNISGTISGSTYDLVPAADWNGSAEITVTVADDGTGTLSDVETFTFTVNPINDAPVLGPTADQSTDEDITLSGLTVDFTDPDAGDTHTIDIASDDANVTAANISGTVSGSTYDLVPAADWNGSAEITVTVTEDGTGALSDVETFTFTVNPINDAPVLSPTADQSADEDNTLTGLSVAFTDAEAGDTHTIDIASDDANVTAVNISGTVSGSTYDLVPAADWNGSAEITVTVTDDGTGTLSDVETFTFTVNPINDAPDSVLISNNTVDERVALETVVGLFSSEDVDLTDTHSYTFILDGGVYDVDNDAFIIVGDTLKTNVNLDFEGQSSYSILVQSDDGQGSTLSQNFTISVNDLDETGVEDIYNNASFNVYPVPAIDNITVEVDNPDNKELLLEIYSNTGRLVLTEPVYSKSRIDLTGFADGMYILTIKGEQVYGTRKIIVKDR